MKIYASVNNELDEFIGTDLWVHARCRGDFWDCYINIVSVDDVGIARCHKLYDRYINDPYYYDCIDYDFDTSVCESIRFSKIKIILPLEVITTDEIYDMVGTDFRHTEFYKRRHQQ